jgi:BirA family transcriptional regulator, biotin operon repressor / biotin---[acetyl-CoA-carboxylase] ligase
MPVELNEEALRRALRSAGLPDGSVRWDALTESTNATALAMAREGTPEWTLVAAGHQLQGRGRLGRTWESAPGDSLLFSVVLRPELPPDRAVLLTLLAGAAMALSCRVAGVVDVECKWPNDLLLDGAKFSGILIEGEGGEEGGAVAVGIGVNCANHPADTDFPATDLAAAGAQVSPEDLFAVLSVKMVGRIAQWNQGEHFATIRTDWLSRAAGLGAAIRVRLPDRELAGQFETVDDTGRLVLLLPDGSHEEIAAGDVVQLAPPGRP